MHCFHHQRQKMKKNPSPSKDSTTTTPPPPPSSPPQHPPPGDGGDVVVVVVVPTPSEVTNPTGPGLEGAEEVMKTAAQVLEDLAGTGSDDSGNGGGGGNRSVPLGSGGGGENAGGAVAVGVAGGGGGGIVTRDKRKSGGGGGVEVVGKEKEITKKPRLSEVKDPPTGEPTCPICNRKFQTWKGAFGHMRSHPDREYRGFFRPPVFGSSSSSPAAPPSNADKDNNKGADVGEASKQGDGEKKAVFDLNNPMMEGGEGSSSAAAAVAVAAAAVGNNAPDEAVVEERVVQEEGRNFRGFDLNEMPKDDDDEE